jgi:hypothetical protein
VSPSVIKQFSNFVLLHRPGPSNLSGRGPQQLLCAGSWAASLKCTVSGILNHLKYCATFYSICDRGPNKRTWRAAGWTPRDIDTPCKTALFHLLLQLLRACCLYRVIQEENSIFWQVIVSVIVRKQVAMNMCIILIAYSNRAVSIYKYRSIVSVNIDREIG